MTRVEGRRFVLTGGRQGEIVPAVWEEPEVGQSLIRVHANGICASDLPIWDTPQKEYPIELGHEPIGQVIALGPGSRQTLGSWVVGRIDPSFADYAYASDEDAVPVPAGLDPDHVLGEPLGCVMYGLERTRLRPGATAAVIGLGFMGLVMVQLLRAAGASRIVAIDPRDDARDTAARVGADETHAPAELQGVGELVDVVVEASGTQPGLDLATRLVRTHGTISILGYHQSARTVDMEAWNWKALDVANAHVRNRAALRASTSAGLALQAAGRIDIATLITHRFDLDHVDDAFRALRDKPRGYVKAAISLD